jgi:hypothetical protein
MENLYFTSNKTYPDGDSTRLPCLFSTEYQDKFFNNIPNKITISNVDILNVQYDGVYAYLGLTATIIHIDHLNIDGIGWLELQDD